MFIPYLLQVYLVTSVSLFALPSLSPSIFSGSYQTLTLPYVLPIAHIGMVSMAVSHQGGGAIVDCGF